jgi:hypothetical protein
MYIQVGMLPHPYMYFAKALSLHVGVMDNLVVITLYATYYKAENPMYWSI